VANKEEEKKRKLQSSSRRRFQIDEPNRILLILSRIEESVRNARGKATKSASDRAPIARRNVSLRF